jgi:glycosyltransferase involved in cell wall biosynthesis
LGDGLRTFGLLKPLVGTHTFDLLCFGRHENTQDDDARAVFSDISVLPFPQMNGTSLPRRVLGKLSVDEFKPATLEMRESVRSAIAGGTYDLIFESGANALVNLPDEPLRIPLVVDSIDEPLLRDFREVRHAPLRNRPSLVHQAWMFWRYERTFLKRADLNIYASENDARTYARFFPTRRVAVVPNGVDTTYFAPMPRPPGPPTVLFEGNMDFRPNVDAAVRLVRDILPHLLALVPGARVQIVGRNPTSEVQELASECVEVTGTVPDVRPYLAGADVFACPMTLGSGIKNKILQAWAMARPVVASSASLGGIAARDGYNLLLRDPPQEFAAAIARLISDPAVADGLARAGRTTVEAEATWERRAQQLDAILRDVRRSREGALQASSESPEAVAPR